MKYRRPGKLRPFERPRDALLAAILILGLGAGGYALTHTYAFFIGGVVAIVSAFIQHRRTKQTTRSPDVG